MGSIVEEKDNADVIPESMSAALLLLTSMCARAAPPRTAPSERELPWVPLVDATLATPEFEPAVLTSEDAAAGTSSIAEAAAAAAPAAGSGRCVNKRNFAAAGG